MLSNTETNINLVMEMQQFVWTRYKNILMEYPDLFALCSRAFQAFDKDNTGHIPAKVWWKWWLLNYFRWNHKKLVMGWTPQWKHCFTSWVFVEQPNFQTEEKKLPSFHSGVDCSPEVNGSEPDGQPSPWYDQWGYNQRYDQWGFNQRYSVFFY